MRAPYYETTLHKMIRAKREDRHNRISRDLDEYGSSVLESEELSKAYDQQHHLWSTVGDHTLRVAMSSVMICYALRKLHIPTNIPAVVVGSLCHDLGILGRKEKYENNRECAREHPSDSVRVAREIVPDLSEQSADIIERHMWPAGGSDAPNSMEGVIVSVADKYCAVKDLIKGSDSMDTGVRNVIRRQKEEARGAVNRQKEAIKGLFEEIEDE